MNCTGDPLRDFEINDAEQQARLDKLPKCVFCDEPIQEEFCYEIDGELICGVCLEGNFKKLTEDFIN